MFWKRPSNDRDWAPQLKLLPHVVFERDDIVRVEHVRNVTYRADTGFDVSYSDIRYDLRAIRAVRLFILPFLGFGIAHLFMRFDFEQGASLAVSIEARKQRGEKFSLKCLVPGHFEITYVLADPRDGLLLQTDIAQQDVRVFDLALTAAQARATLVDMLRYAEQLETRPRFYHPFVRACGINTARHLRAAGVPLPRTSLHYVLPERFDMVLRRRNVLAASH